MTLHALQLRHRFLVAMGLGSLTLGLLQACGTAEDPSSEADGTAPFEPPEPVDSDHDGFSKDQDCDDSSAAVNPEAEEVCDGIDNNCDGVIDTDAMDQVTWYADGDADGYGDPAQPIRACDVPEGAVGNDTDCATEDVAIHPGAEETLQDRLDNDCDGRVDEMACPESTVPTRVKDIQADRGRTPLQFCVDRPEDGTPCPGAHQIKASRLVNDVVGTAPSGTSDTLGPYSSAWRIEDAVCGPDEATPEECCYVFRVEEERESLFGTPGTLEPSRAGHHDVLMGPDSKPVHGRPLTVHGAARTATTISTKDWDQVLNMELSELTKSQRAQVAQVWEEAALYEHASVASFARVSLELMALEAPPELLMAATRAQADEIAHARSCFSMASAFSGRALGPGPLDLSDAMDSAPTPERMLVQTILEGCINETVAAAEGAWLSEQAKIRAVGRVQKQIAEDEARHAALAWKTVRWLLQKHPRLVTLAQETFERARPTTPRLISNNDEWMAAYGCMPEAERAALKVDVWARVIGPCSEVLVTASRKEARSPATV